MTLINEVKKIISHNYCNQRSFAIEDITAGARNQVGRVRFSDASLGVVVKLYRDQDAVKRAKAEAYACNSLRDSLVPVPEIYVLDVSYAVSSYPYIVMSVVPGRPLETLIERITAQHRQDIASQVATLAARINRVPVPFFGDIPPDANASFSNWSNFFIARLQRGLVSCVERGLIDLEFVTRCMTAVETRRAILACSQASLTHGDLIPKNIHVTQELNGWNVSGVYDFECATASCHDWEFAQIRRTLFERFPDTKDVFLHTYEREYGLPVEFTSRLQVYQVAEAIEFWIWGIDHGFEEEVHAGVRKTSDLIDSILSKESKL